MRCDIYKKILQHALFHFFLERSLQNIRACHVDDIGKHSLSLQTVFICTGHVELMHGLFEIKYTKQIYSH